MRLIFILLSCMIISTLSYIHIISRNNIVSDYNMPPSLYNHNNTLNIDNLHSVIDKNDIYNIYHHDKLIAKLKFNAINITIYHDKGFINIELQNYKNKDLPLIILFNENFYEPLPLSLLYSFYSFFKPIDRTNIKYVQNLDKGDYYKSTSYTRSSVVIKSNDGTEWYLLCTRLKCDNLTLIKSYAITIILDSMHKYKYIKYNVKSLIKL